VPEPTAIRNIGIEVVEGLHTFEKCDVKVAVSFGEILKEPFDDVHSV
jgi:hypothetical protein